MWGYAFLTRHALLHPDAAAGLAHLLQDGVGRQEASCGLWGPCGVELGPQLSLLPGCQPVMQGLVSDTSRSRFLDCHKRTESIRSPCTCCTVSERASHRVAVSRMAQPSGFSLSTLMRRSKSALMWSIEGREP